MWWHESVISKHSPVAKSWVNNSSMSKIIFIYYITLMWRTDSVVSPSQKRIKNKNGNSNTALKRIWKFSIVQCCTATRCWRGQILQTFARMCSPFTSPAVLAGVQAALAILLRALGESGSTAPLQRFVEQGAAEPSQAAPAQARLSGSPRVWEHAVCRAIHNAAVPAAESPTQ